MRKIEYTQLARIIGAQKQLAVDMANSPEKREFANGIISACETIAREFAGVAHVDKAQFLRACGIESLT